MDKVRKATTYLDDNNLPYLEMETTDYVAEDGAKYTDCDKVYELAKAIKMDRRASEMVLLLVFDSALHLICISEISTGSIDRSIMSPREIAQTMLLAGGVNCILLHNHPSGNCEPSEIDIATTRQIIDALNLLSLKVLDHMVVGKDTYVSMNRDGLL